jgi:hypothetical protein
MSQDQYYYVSRISSVVETLADAIITRSIMPRIPNIGQMCQGIQIVAKDYERASMSRKLGFAWHPAAGEDSDHGVPAGTLADPSMMDRMLQRVAPVAKGENHTVHVWPASLHLSPAEPPSLRDVLSTSTSSDHQIHLLPILFQRRWTLFRVDRQRSVIDFVDFLSSSIGCELSTFQVSSDSKTQPLVETDRNRRLRSG